LQRLMARDPWFRHFIFKHIDGAANKRDLRRVIRYARQRCYPATQRLCYELENAAARALGQGGR
jgi:hypothetical protein